MRESSPADNISFVLVETMQAGNVGSAARAMKNMGLTQLRLVNPPDLSEQECRNLAVSAIDIVERAPVYDRLQTAIGDQQVVVATTSSRGRRQRTQLHTVRSLAPRILDYAADQKVCILFGPERRGLTDDQLALSQYLMTIPSSPDFPTLNVAQSVAIVAYELFCVENRGLEVVEKSAVRMASQESKDAMFQHVENTLVQIGFLSQSNPGHIMKAIRRFLGKADLTKRDIRILRGIMSQMEWYIREGKDLEPKRVKKP